MKSAFYILQLIFMEKNAKERKRESSRNKRNNEIHYRIASFPFTFNYIINKHGTRERNRENLSRCPGCEEKRCVEQKHVFLYDVILS